MESKLKHLDFIQSIITRMAKNSFMIKGWCITLVSAIIALAVKEDITELMIVTAIPIIMFWVIDGFFLFQERLYRSLYDVIRGLSEDKIDFSLSTSKHVKGKNTWLCSTFSKTLMLTYFSLLILVLVTYFFLSCWG